MRLGHNVMIVVIGALHADQEMIKEATVHLISSEELLLVQVAQVAPEVQVGSKAIGLNLILDVKLKAIIVHVKTIVEDVLRKIVVIIKTHVTACLTKFRFVP